MKIILYLAMTANGYIAKENNNTPQSNQEWESFSEMVNQCKNLIIGRKTFEIMKKENEFEKIGNPFTIVVSDRQEENLNFVNSPKNAINLMKEKYFSKILVAGGGMLNLSFMKEGLIVGKFLKVLHQQDLHQLVSR